MRAILKLSTIAVLMCFIHQHLLDVAEWSLTLQRDWTDFRSNASTVQHFHPPAQASVADEASAPENLAVAAAISAPLTHAHHHHWRRSCDN